MRRDRDGPLDGRLNMGNHRISGLADPTEADDAVTRRYVASRLQELSDVVQGNKRKLDAFQNLFGAENNQVLIREYEIIGTDFERFFRARIDTEGGNIGTSFLFRKYLRVPDDTNEFGFIDIFTLKEYFYIYLKNLLTPLHG